MPQAKFDNILMECYSLDSFILYKRALNSLTSIQTPGTTKRVCPTWSYTELSQATRDLGSLAADLCQCRGDAFTGDIEESILWNFEMLSVFLCPIFVFLRL